MVTRRRANPKIEKVNVGSIRMKATHERRRNRRPATGDGRRAIVSETGGGRQATGDRQCSRIDAWSCANATAGFAIDSISCTVDPPGSSTDVCVRESALPVAGRRSPAACFREGCPLPVARCLLPVSERVAGQRQLDLNRRAFERSSSQDGVRSRCCTFTVSAAVGDRPSRAPARHALLGAAVHEILVR